MKIYDLIIIGGGPAAMSAGIYAARRKMRTAIIAQAFGGQMNASYVIENYLGPYGTPGPDLAKKFIWHLNVYKKDLDIKEGETVKKISGCETFEKTVITDKGEYKTKSIIIATGKIERKLDIKGAEEFERKGVTYCATCDAPLFKDKTVAVVGAGDSGIDTVDQLTHYASKIYWLNKYEQPKGTQVNVARTLMKNPKVEYFPQCLPKEIKGDKFVGSLVCEDLATKEEREIEVQGIFVEIGMTPKIDFINGCLKMNEAGEVIVDHRTCATSVPGIFAAGDVADTKHKQIVVAAGQGAIAALSVAEYLKNNNYN